jgi:phage-related protein (TIGR01555 family)
MGKKLKKLQREIAALEALLSAKPATTSTVMVDTKRPLRMSGAASRITKPDHIGPSFAQLMAPAVPPPGVVPKDGVLMAADDCIAGGWGASTVDFSNLAQTYMSGWMGYPMLAQLSQMPDYRKASSIRAQELTRRWIKLHAVGDGNKSEKIKLLWDAMRKFRVQELFYHVALTDGLFGRAQIYIDTGDSDRPNELVTPLIKDKRKIQKGDLKAIRLIEPVWTYPGLYNAADPLKDSFYRPDVWYVMGRTIHRTRLLTFVSKPVPDYLKAAYNFGGLSMTQILRSSVEHWLRTRESVSDLVHSFSVSGIKTDMSSAMMGDEGGIEDLIVRADMFNKFRDNRGMMVLNKGGGTENPEEFFNVSTPLGGLDALQAQSQEHVASDAQIPLVKYFGITPHGLNPSTDGEVRTFYDTTNAEQPVFLGDHLRTIIDIIQLSEFGEIDPEIDFTWESLWTMDESATASIRKTNADTAGVMIADGIISPEEERTRLAAEEGGLYNGLDPNDIPEPPEQDLNPEAPNSKNESEPTSTEG